MTHNNYSYNLNFSRYDLSVKSSAELEKLQSKIETKKKEVEKKLFNFSSDNAGLDKYEANNLKQHLENAKKTLTSKLNNVEDALTEKTEKETKQKELKQADNEQQKTDVQKNDLSQTNTQNEKITSGKPKETVAAQIAGIAGKKETSKTNSKRNTKNNNFTKTKKNTESGINISSAVSNNDKDIRDSKKSESFKISSVDSQIDEKQEKTTNPFSKTFQSNFVLQQSNSASDVTQQQFTNALDALKSNSVKSGVSSSDLESAISKAVGGSGTSGNNPFSYGQSALNKGYEAKAKTQGIINKIKNYINQAKNSKSSMKSQLSQTDDVKENVDSKTTAFDVGSSTVATSKRQSEIKDATGTDAVQSIGQTADTGSAKVRNASVKNISETFKQENSNTQGLEGHDDIASQLDSLSGTETSAIEAATSSTDAAVSAENTQNQAASKITTNVSVATNAASAEQSATSSAQSLVSQTNILGSLINSDNKSISIGNQNIEDASARAAEAAEKDAAAKATQQKSIQDVNRAASKEQEDYGVAGAAMMQILAGLFQVMMGIAMMMTNPEQGMQMIQQGLQQIMSGMQAAQDAGDDAETSEKARQIAQKYYDNAAAKRAEATEEQAEAEETANNEDLSNESDEQNIKQIASNIENILRTVAVQQDEAAEQRDKKENAENEIAASEQEAQSAAQVKESNLAQAAQSNAQAQQATAQAVELTGISDDRGCENIDGASTGNTCTGSSASSSQNIDSGSNNNSSGNPFALSNSMGGNKFGIAAYKKSQKGKNDKKSTEKANKSNSQKKENETTKNKKEK